MGVFMLVPMNMAVLVLVIMVMPVCQVVVMLMLMSVIVIMRQMDVEFHPGDGGFLLAGDMEVIAIEPELFQLAFEPARIDSEIKQCGDEHIARDAADEVKVKNFHRFLPELYARDSTNARGSCADASCFAAKALI